MEVRGGSFFVPYGAKLAALKFDKLIFYKKEIDISLLFL